MSALLLLALAALLSGAGCRTVSMPPLRLALANALDVQPTRDRDAARSAIRELLLEFWLKRDGIVNAGARNAKLKLDRALPRHLVAAAVIFTSGLDPARTTRAERRALADDFEAMITTTLRTL